MDPFSSLQPKLMLSEQERRNSCACHAAGGQMVPIWHKLQFWVLPEPHHFLSGFATFSSTLAFNVDLSTPALAYMWEHQV